MIPDDIVRELFDLALKVEIGIGVKTDDPKAFRQELIIWRSKNPNLEYSKLQFALPNMEEVWIFKKGVDLE